jgi:hypothetical protein
MYITLSQHQIRHQIVLAVVMLFGGVGIANAGDRSALEEALQSKYQLTKTGIDRVRITEPGTILVIQKEGISGDLSSDMSFLNNKVRDGQVAQAGGFGAMMQDKKTSRTLKVGDKVYVFKIKVKDDHVRYFIITGDTYDVNVHGSTRQTRYKALLSFELGKEFLESASVDDVKKVVDAVIAPEAEVKAANTESVELGQSPTQVETILGRPDKIINLGAKKVYVYKDMKIVFVDEKVADVQ